jgi:hypothetical protein
MNIVFLIQVYTSEINGYTERSAVPYMLRHYPEDKDSYGVFAPVL